jgi:protease I
MIRMHGGSMRLRGKKIVVLAGPGYEDLELHYPRLRLLEEGAEVLVAGIGDPEYKGKIGYPVRAERVAAPELADSYDGLIVPGGSAPDRMRLHAGAVALVRRMDELGRPIGAICHGPQLLISARVVEGRTLTSYASVKDDLVNARVKEWVDREVVVDRNLVTARVPNDLGPFMREFIALVAR